MSMLNCNDLPPLHSIYSCSSWHFGPAYQQPECSHRTIVIPTPGHAAPIAAQGLDPPFGAVYLLSWMTALRFFVMNNKAITQHTATRHQTHTSSSKPLRRPHLATPHHSKFRPKRFGTSSATLLLRARFATREQYAARVCVTTLNVSVWMSLVIP